MRVQVEGDSHVPDDDDDDDNDTANLILFITVVSPSLVWKDSEPKVRGMMPAV